MCTVSLPERSHAHRPAHLFDRHGNIAAVRCWLWPPVKRPRVIAAAGHVMIANDVEFIDAMVPHHEMAVMMADIELQAGSDAHVKVPHHAGAIQMAHNALPNLKEANLKTMAMAIIESQAEEVGMLHGMLQSM